ncbi:alpha/beta hydrolase [Bifidobacterium aerophilum]|uniref:Esterase n=1 Tax=Bifidobacterium aerophilum TaxID=1798155 RepID=A0A6N9Z303_9BIFI|nr:alpha/beta hydrolase-fold protein [Bifidobacterium aerophilum]NEG88633.1 esterase [Bifidobacterium aerophilum]
MEGSASWVRSLMSMELVSGPVPAVAYALGAAGLVLLIVWQALRDDRRLLFGQAMAAVGGGALGLLTAWLISDGIMVFGVSLGWPVIFTAAAGCATVGFAIATAVRAHRLRRVIAVLMVPVLLVCTGLRIDAIYGEYQTLGALFNYSPYRSVDSAGLKDASISVAQWRKLAEDGELPSMPDHGTTYSQHIDNSHSGFRARDALVWMPPAALSETPPRLPVLILLAGQPGSPGRAMSASGIATLLDDYAAAHDGLAPIVVSPDQNGADTINSLCADTTKHGKAETYLTRDVPDWIRAHLPASANTKDWAIGGFSQGGTCSTQLAPRHPDLFGTMIAVDGEIAPTDGGVDHLVASYFGGDRAKYEEQVPVNAIAAHAPSDQAAVLAAGENDTASVANVRTIGKAAREAGMDTVTLEVPGTGHDWHAVNATLQAALPWWCARIGLGATHKTWSDYTRLKVIR